VPRYGAYVSHEDLEETALKLRRLLLFDVNGCNQQPTRDMFRKLSSVLASAITTFETRVASAAVRSLSLDFIRRDGAGRREEMFSLKRARR